MIVAHHEAAYPLVVLLAGGGALTMVLVFARKTWRSEQRAERQAKSQR